MYRFVILGFCHRYRTCCTNLFTNIIVRIHKNFGMDSDTDSDYDVEAYVKPDFVNKYRNDDSADLLGNFDDEKRKEVFGKDISSNQTQVDEIQNFGEEDPFAEVSTEEVEQQDEEVTEQKTPTVVNKKPNHLTDEQITSLLRGRTKTDRFVLYVTNLNFDTTKTELEEHFGVVGSVKSVRIPKKKKGFAFVEMMDVKGFQMGLTLHDTMLHGRKIKIQITEAGKNSSANKRNILLQKNRKLAEMRSESKAFTKSGKFYQKSLKYDKSKKLADKKNKRAKNKRKPKPNTKV